VGCLLFQFRLLFQLLQYFAGRGDFNARKDFTIRLIFSNRKDFTIRLILAGCKYFSVLYFSALYKV
jgi:hypothetical protein